MQVQALEQVHIDKTSTISADDLMGKHVVCHGALPYRTFGGLFRISKSLVVTPEPIEDKPHPGLAPAEDADENDLLAIPEFLDRRKAN